jgi:arsenate reductase
MKKRVLFLCATNGVLSPIAEALLHRIDSENFEAASAGISSGKMHPLTVEVMREVGIELNRKTPRPVKEVLNRNFDFVITVCDRAKVQCPVFHGAETVHWQFEDPTAFPVDSERQIRKFRMIRDQLNRRLHLFVLVQVRPRILAMSGASG